MMPERWQRINELFQSALERESGERAAFLAEACAGDTSLRGEIESLLAAHDEAGTFMDAPAIRLEAGGPGFLSPGSRLGPYEVVAFLGSGGMGEVYRAWDTRLGRDVAVKILPGVSADEGERRRRFEQEARAAGALNHPNVLTVFDVGVVDDIHYVVSELLSGETLRTRLEAGSLPLLDCLDYARQIVAGLAAAHEGGIVHRDLKPENLFVTTEARVKILDFGLAKRVEPAAREAGVDAPTAPLRTIPGTVLGTVGYMSPEQVRGLPTDPRSDIFAFGAVLYEMLTGRRAFPGDSDADAMSAILRDDPPPASGSAPEVPGGLEAIVERCLRKDPKGRFDSTRELALALDSVASSAEAAPRRRSVAILPFRDLSAEPGGAHLGLGLADATITELARIKSLLVRPTSAVLRYRDHPVDALRAARELGVDAIVEASFQRSGPRLRVTAQVSDGRDGRSLWAGKIDASLDDVFAMQDEVARSIARALEVELNPLDEVRHAESRRPAVPSAETYELYLKGKLNLLGESLSDFVAAVDWFERARERDPAFALAWVGLADAYARLAFTFQPEGDWYARARTACERALALDPTLPEARYVRARLHWGPQGGFDHASAVRELIPVLQARPNFEEGHVLLGNVLHHVGLFDEAQALYERAQAVSPGHPRARSHVVMCLGNVGHYAEALELAQSIPSGAVGLWLEYQIGLCQVHLGRFNDAEETILGMTRRVPGEILAFPLQGLIAARRGDAAEADRQVRLTEENHKGYGHYHHARYDVACIHALFGRAEEAVRWLRDTARDGYPCVSHFERDEFLASLRGDESFERLIADLKKDREGYRRLYQELSEAGNVASPALGMRPV